MALSIQETPEGVMVAVRVAPRSSRSGMDGAVGDALRVRVTAAPVDTTIAGGKVLMKHKEVLTMDDEKICAHAARLAPDTWKRFAAL